MPHPPEEQACLIRQVLEAVGATGLDKLGHAHLTVEFEAGDVANGAAVLHD